MRLMCHISTWFSSHPIIRFSLTSQLPYGLFCMNYDTISNNTRVTYCVVAPGEQPPSSMTPAILESSSGETLVIGGSGGTMITTALASVKHPQATKLNTQRPPPRPSTVTRLALPWLPPPSSRPWWTTCGSAWACRRPSQPPWCLWTQGTHWSLSVASIRLVNIFIMLIIIIFIVLINMIPTPNPLTPTCCFMTCLCGVLPQPAP